MSEWISVDDELPLAYRSVLVGWKDGSIEIMFIETRLDGSDPKWSKRYSSDPTHWQPLPEPPK